MTNRREEDQRAIIVSISMTPQERRSLDNEAKIMGVTRSAFVQRLLATWLEYRRDQEGKE
jgi:hypothetical protein